LGERVGLEISLLLLLGVAAGDAVSVLSSMVEEFMFFGAF